MNKFVRLLKERYVEHTSTGGYYIMPEDLAELISEIDDETPPFGVASCRLSCGAFALFVQLEVVLN